MAYSPSPTSPTMGRQHRSPTPPIQPLSKRDKKRNAHQERYLDLTADFAQNRDLYFRKQLTSLQTDMMLITQADPYEPEPLDDSPEDIAHQVESALAGTPYQSELSGSAGKWYAKFVQDVNTAKEGKEIELTQLMTRHEDNLARMKKEYDFKLRLASEECDNLSNTLRERIAKTLSERKARLLKEKEHLDIADTNAILLHPSQFSITNPSSPGGHQGSRKTRHARNRLEDDLGAGLLVDAGIKRKRKLFEDNIGSPTRDGNSTPSDRKQARLLAQQAAPVLSFATLFSDKDLKSATSEAYIATQHFFATSKKAGSGAGALTNGKANDGDSTALTAAALAAEDATNNSDTNDINNSIEDALTAPEMDRSASTQTNTNFHATRSTRHNATINATSAMAGMNILSDLAEKAATRPPVPYFLLGTYPTRQGATLPPPPSLMLEEQDDDLHRIQETTRKSKGWADKKILDDVVGEDNDNGNGKYEGMATAAAAALGLGNLDPRFPLWMGVHLVDAAAAAAYRDSSTAAATVGTPSKA